LHSAIKIHYINVNDIKHKVDDMATSARLCCSKTRSISQRLSWSIRLYPLEIG